MNLQGKKVTLHDMSLRDGMHPKRQQISLEQMIAVATGLDEAGLICEHDELDPIPQTRLLENVSHVGLDSAGAQDQRFRDLSVREAVRDQPRDLEFALRQLLEL